MSRPRAATPGTFLAVVLSLCSACTIGDGEGPRWVGRVVSVSPTQVCIGPNTVRTRVTCGSVPEGIKAADLPQVGQCVSLFAHTSDKSKTLDWTATSLRLKIDDSKCRRSHSGP